MASTIDNSLFAFGVDGSRFQYLPPRLWDFSALPEAGVCFVGIRAGISWGYADPWFSRSWSEAKAYTLCRLAYHVIYFGEDPVKQIDNLFRIVPGDWEHDKLVLDLEVAADWSRAKITETTRRCMELIKQRVGFYPINYSRAGWINTFLDVTQLPVCDWWLAGYRNRWLYPLYTPEALPPPALPHGVSNWLIHQTAERGKGIGTASYYMDYNRWHGSVGDVYQYFGYADILEPPIYYWEVRITATDGLRIREQPTTASARIGVLPYNKVVEVSGKQGDWLKLANEPGWVYGKYTKAI